MKATPSKKIKSFTDLVVWQRAHTYVVDIYKISKQFPKEEMFGLTSQLRRATVSITSNIAEGFGRHSYKDKLHFYIIARGSLTESQNQLLIARDVEYLSQENFVILNKQTVTISKLLNGLISSTRKRSAT